MRKSETVHMAADCPNTKIYCNQCGKGKQSNMLRHELQHHLAEECTVTSTCKVCRAVYFKGVKQAGKDYDHKCSDYIL